MPGVKVNVKWGKETYTGIEADPEQPPLVFKSQLFALTGVPPDRQKVMIKGILLKDDEWGKAMPKEGAAVMLMGSAEAVAVEAPKNAPKFVEDLPEEEQEHQDTKDFGAGLTNLGNTCYMNATMQCMFGVSPLRQALYTHAPPGVDDSALLARATRDLFRDLERGGAPFTPYAFLMALRKRFPQFGETGAQGVPMQQDAEECWRGVMQVLREKVKAEDGTPAVNRLFGVGTRLRLEAAGASEGAPVAAMEEEGLADLLKCNVDEKTGHLSEGIALGLREEREKRDEEGHVRVYRGKAEISSLPPYVTVQMMRFFFRRDTQQKAKILKKVVFPLELDLYEFCTPALRAALDGPRTTLKDAQDAAAQAKKTAKAAVPGAHAAAPVPQARDSGADAAASAGEAATAGPSVTSATGKYELCGVVTHKGRTADSGHYVAWVKQASGQWVCFDDDKLTLRSEDEVLALSGGGDWHMAYLLMYRAITAAAKEQPLAAAAAVDKAVAPPAVPVGDKTDAPATSDPAASDVPMSDA